MSYGWSPYVPVAKRRAQAKKKIDKLRKGGQNIQPIEIEGRKITKTFWGSAWCTHLENFSDYDNRLPRGRTYVRNGSVCHLEIKKKTVTAMVSGSSLYNVKIEVSPLKETHWAAIRAECSGKMGSLLELLQGKLSSSVMEVITHADLGIFPKPNEIKMSCDCPDWADMCKHIAAVLYGVGARLDDSPELLFLLRDVDHMDLLDSDISIPQRSPIKPQVSGDLSDIFGIELEGSSPVALKQSKASEKNITPKKGVENKKLNLKKKSKAEQKPSDETINISRGIRASHIKKLRQNLNITTAELAQLTEKTVTTVKKWELTKGALTLRSASQTALEKVFQMSESEAKKYLSR
jgi:uncharacterized Zn finger protein